MEYTAEFYRQCLELRSKALEQAHRTGEAFDKYIVTLASASLALLLTYLEKIAPNPQEREVLYASVGCFIVSLSSVVIANFFSQLATMQYVNSLQQLMDGGQFPKTPWWYNTARWMSLLALITFVVGLTALCLFVVVNLPEEIS